MSNIAKLYIQYFVNLHHLDSV